MYWQHPRDRHAVAEAVCDRELLLQKAAELPEAQPVRRRCVAAATGAATGTDVCQCATMYQCRPRTVAAIMASSLARRGIGTLTRGRQTDGPVRWTQPQPQGRPLPLPSCSMRAGGCDPAGSGPTPHRCCIVRSPEASLHVRHTSGTWPRSGTGMAGQCSGALGLQCTGRCWAGTAGHAWHVTGPTATRCCRGLGACGDGATAACRSAWRGIRSAEALRCGGTVHIHQCRV